ncbi:MAG: hypothetical protein HYZ58_14315 [Acidobacteria bacterium]|nr:hypothetical protein [Acidobacteriota bacterium]
MKTRGQVEEEIQCRLEAERARLERQAGLTKSAVAHFHRPVERPFTAAERDRVTILIGGLTWKHDSFLQAAFQSAGYHVEVLPIPDVAAFQLGKEYEVRGRLGQLEVDRLRVKPIVKVTGEFWAQTTEGAGNFRMFSFLEREGAQVMVEPIGTWAMYMLWFAKATFASRRGVYAPTRSVWAVHARLADEVKFRLKLLSFEIGRRFYMGQHRRVVDALGGLAHPLVRLEQLAALAAPYYNVFAKGGEGHMEVAKNIYYTVMKKCHMVLSLKPFGCMPSTQSDGVQSAVMSHFKDMIFLPIETSGEGEINAHSRVQMALGEAKVKAKIEFQQALESTATRLEDIKAFVADHPELRHPFYTVPHRPGVVGTAATFVLHVSDLMNGRARPWPVPGLPSRAAPAETVVPAAVAD